MSRKRLFFCSYMVQTYLDIINHHLDRERNISDNLSFEYDRKWYIPGPQLQTKLSCMRTRYTYYTNVKINYDYLSG